MLCDVQVTIKVKDSDLIACINEHRARKITAKYGLSENYEPGTGPFLSSESKVKTSRALAKAIFGTNRFKGRLKARVAASIDPTTKAISGSIALFIPGADKSDPLNKSLFAFPLGRKLPENSRYDIKAKLGKHFSKTFPDDLPGSEFSGELEVVFVEDTGELGRLF